MTEITFENDHDQNTILREERGGKERKKPPTERVLLVIATLGASARMTVGTRWGVLVFFLNGSRHSECSMKIPLNHLLFLIGRVVGGGLEAGLEGGC